MIPLSRLEKFRWNAKPDLTHRMDGVEQRILEEEGMMSSWQNTAKEEKVRNLGHLHPVQRRLRRHSYNWISIWRWVLVGCHSCKFAMSHTRAQWGSPRGVIWINLCEENVPHGLALWQLAKHKGGYAGYLISLWIHIMGIFDKQGRKHLSGITYELGTHVQSEQEESQDCKVWLLLLLHALFLFKLFFSPSSSKGFFYSSRI